MKFSIDIWRDKLWNHFEQYIHSDKLFYLNADESLIEKIAYDIDPNQPSEIVARSFHSECKSLFSYKSAAKLELIDGALCNKYNTRSYAICLAVQQVLAVELMKKKENAHTHNAYYPGYANMLEMTDDKCPLTYASFQAIWNQLEKEILLFNKDVIITFKNGTGRRKYTNYPISQALLSYHDLEKIYLFYDKKKKLPVNIVQKIRHRLKKLNLSKRAFKILMNDNLIDSVNEQILYFFYTYEVISEFPKVEPLPNIDFNGSFIIEVIEDWTGEKEYDFYHERDNSSEVYQNNIDFILELYFTQQNIMLMVRNLNVYKQYHKRVKLKSDTSYIFVTKKSNKNQVIHKLSNYYGKIQYDVIENVDYLNDYSIILIEDIPDRSFTVDFYKDSFFKISEKSASLITLDGGLCVDKRSNKYLRGYPPKTILFKDSELDPNDLISINSININYSRYQNESKDFSDGMFTFEYKNIHKEFELVDTKSDLNKSLISYQFNNNYLNHITRKHQEDLDNFYRFFSLKYKDNNTKEKTPKNIQINASHFQSNISDWLPVSRKILPDLLSQLFSETEFSDSEKKIITQIVNASCSFPPYIYNKLIS